MAIRCKTTSPPLTIANRMFLFVFPKNKLSTLRFMLMRNKILGCFTFLLVTISSCQKCYECKQYCAYCKSISNPGLVIKVCSNNDINYTKVDSFRNAYQSNGFTCSLLQDDKNVCDGKTKINDAINYYILENYFCYPTK